MGKSIKTLIARTKNKTYNILIGQSVLSQIKKMDDILLKDRFAIIVSRNVMELHQYVIEKALSKYTNYDIFPIKDGEKYKNLRYSEVILDRMLKSGYTRKSVIIAIGGGVVGDFAGFIASIFMRGIPIIHMPTTLLAMVDSSIGGKVAVNLSSGKNIVGLFHQPEVVISDLNFIKTLPENELKNGLTEVLKHAVIGGKKLLKLFHENDLKSITNADIIEKIVYLSVLFKSRIVQKDEHENSVRAILNFGHTAGHAIESLLKHRKISHGEAVAIGLLIEMEISKRFGWLSEGEIKDIKEIINRYNLIYNNYRLNPDFIIKHMKYDKKNISGKINFVLLKGLCNPVYNQEVEPVIIKDAIKTILHY